MVTIKNIAYAVLLILFTSFFLGCVSTKGPQADGKALYTYITKDNDYKKWKMWPGTGALYPRATDKPSEPHGVFLTTYVTDNAYSAIEGKNGSLPDESIIVKENYNPDKTLGSISVMYKESGYDPEHNDWFWARYAPNGTITAEGKVMGCINCHGLPKPMFNNQTNDYIWTSNLK